MAKSKLRPLRTLTIFGLVTVVLYGLAALGGDWKPRLGLDLEGGTRITLSAAETPTRENLQLATDIIDKRVNGSGVSEAEVTSQGDRNIVVEIPGAGRRDLVDVVKRTAQLRFRVVSGAPADGQAAPTQDGPPPPPAATPSAKASVQPTQPSASPSATPKSRVAPALTDTAATPAPSAPAATAPAPSAPAAPLPSQPAAPTQAAPIDDPIAWATSPGAEWQQKFAEFTCPKAGVAPKADDPDQPLIACDESGAKYLLSTAMIEGTSLRSASFGLSQDSNAWEVRLSFKGAARGVFGDVTQALYQNGGQFAIVLDSQVVQAAGVSTGAIRDGNARITGDFTETEARSLATSLKYGALPIRFTDPTTEIIGPSLAGDQLSAGILAGVIGLSIVMLYCLLYYRGLGLVVIASLAIAAIITYAVVVILSSTAGFTLTLPGIAGLIVAVGITADSFIVYFERIRDEMRDGKSMRVAVETGWRQARNTCLAADAVSLLAAVVLYIFAIGVVKGFAFALGISTLIDVAVFFWFTKPMMTWLATKRFFNSGRKLSGLSPETLGIDAEPARVHAVAGGKA